MSRPAVPWAQILLSVAVVGLTCVLELRSHTLPSQGDQLCSCPSRRFGLGVLGLVPANTLPVRSYLASFGQSVGMFQPSNTRFSVRIRRSPRFSVRFRRSPQLWRLAWSHRFSVGEDQLRSTLSHGSGLLVPWGLFPAARAKLEPALTVWANHRGSAPIAATQRCGKC